MRVLILTDAQFAIHERALLERVMVGLAVEGVEAQLVLPKVYGLGEYSVGLFKDPIEYAHRGLAFTQRIRASQIARQVTDESSGFEGVIDVVHVFGGGAWAMGRELARMLGAGVLFEIWRSGMVESLRSLHLGESDRAMLLAPEKAFLDSIAREGVGLPVRYSPWGAQLSESETPILSSGRAVSVVMMSSGRQKEHALAAFDGVAEAMRSHENVMLFANLELVERTGLWQRVKANRLESRFTIIDRSEDRRDLVLRCDILVYPDVLHEERTLLIDAMGAGMAVIAGADPSIAPLNSDAGVLVIDRPARDQWAKGISSLLADRELAKQSGHAARAYIRQHRRGGLHIESITEAYAELCGIEQESDPV